MRKLLLALFVFTFVSSSYSQYGWHQLNSGTTINLHGVSFFSSEFGMTVGLDGALRKTTNGGLNWNIVSLGIALDLHKIAHVDSLRWTIVGQNGLILYSSDAGNSWIIKSGGTSGNLGSINFIKQNGMISDTGYCPAVGGILLKTTNGGNSWTSSQLNTSNNLYFVKFVNANLGYVGGKGVFFKTTNAGLNWFNVSPSTTHEMSRCEFRDPNNGLIVGGLNYSSNGVIYRTTNGGLNWSTFNAPFGSLKSVQYLPNGNVSVVGNGAILMSYDDGLNWTIQTSPNITTFYQDSQFTTNLIGYTVGNGGEIIKTTTGGITTGVTNVSTEIPSAFKLHQNYPNPFNPVTKIRFEIPVSGIVSFSIFNSIGQEISTPVNKIMQAGIYEYSFDAGKLSSGIYYYKLSSNGNSQIKKMMLIK